MARLLSLNEVSKSKLSVSLRKLQKDVSAGRFGPDVIHLGRSVRVSEEELDSWIKAGCPGRDAWLEMRDAHGGKV